MSAPSGEDESGLLPTVWFGVNAPAQEQRRHYNNAPALVAELVSSRVGDTKNRLQFVTVKRIRDALSAVRLVGAA